MHKKKIIWNSTKEVIRLKEIMIKGKSCKSFFQSLICAFEIQAGLCLKGLVQNYEKNKNFSCVNIDCRNNGSGNDMLF